MCRPAPIRGRLRLRAGAASPATAASGPDHELRVNACRRLFERKSGSKRLFRHEFYALIAQHDSEAWETIGTEQRVTAEHRVTAVQDPKTLRSGSRPAHAITEAWRQAKAGAFDGFKFEHVQGRDDPENLALR